MQRNQKKNQLRRRWIKNKKTEKNTFQRFLFTLLTVCACYLLFLNAKIDREFIANPWDLAAQVYAQPKEIILGDVLFKSDLVEHLEALGYQKTQFVEQEGQFREDASSVSLFRRAFNLWDEKLEPQKIVISFRSGWIDSIFDLEADRALDFFRLDAMYLGQFINHSREQRLLVSGEEIPEFLREAVMALEDRQFNDHFGISPKAILRAAKANFDAGSRVQGGSTITQQLVKNLFLTPEKSLWRKFNEILMALMLETKYSKQQIFEAYLNEIFLGQAGNKAIHGFGLASYHFFGRPLRELSEPEQLTLIALIKAPSAYNPLANPERAKQRRQEILTILEKQGLITPQQRLVWSQQSVAIKPSRKTQIVDSAVLDLVKRQLSQDYSTNDIRQKGLKIFTTIEPAVQKWIRESIRSSVALLQQRASSELEAAVILTRPENGEILGLVGSKSSSTSGFNRLLDAQRQIGSLIKPLVYFTALNQPERYSLSTRLNDESLSLRLGNGALWEPQNFDKKEHGAVLLFESLANSYNLSTARLGVEVGVENLVETLEAFDFNKSFYPYPALTLGALELSPFEIATIYQTIANEGLLTKPTVIKAVIAEGEPLRRYPVVAKRIFPEETMVLLKASLMKSVEEGTAKTLEKQLNIALAGKTGTSDNLRDSWFTGFSGNHLATVWLGNDSNQSIGLTGANGALRVWTEFMKKIKTEPLALPVNDKVEYYWVDRNSGLLVDVSCGNKVRLPFIRGHLPASDPRCAPKITRLSDNRTD
ncbi:MAG: penicillin-binding protein 1B [Pseudomonadota bacterium]